jgi:hypothetical protein
MRNGKYKFVTFAQRRDYMIHGHAQKRSNYKFLITNLQRMRYLQLRTRDRSLQIRILNILPEGLVEGFIMHKRRRQCHDDGVFGTIIFCKSLEVLNSSCVY